MANKLALRPGIKLNKFTPPTHAHMYSRMVQTRYVYVLKCDVKTSMLHFYKLITVREPTSLLVFFNSDLIVRGFGVWAGLYFSCTCRLKAVI